MISSRCNDPIELAGDQRTLSAVRARIKAELEAATLFGAQLFDVWINEDAPPDAADMDSFNVCMDQVEKADIVVVLYNGNAGWASTAGGVGICHAELNHGLATGKTKVRLVQLPLAPLRAGTEGKLDLAFRDYIGRLNLFRGAAAANGEEAIAMSKSAVTAAIADMVKLGKQVSRRGKHDSGEALDWSRLDFSQRKSELERVMRKAVASQPGGHEVGLSVVARVQGEQILFACHGVPAGIAVAAAREMVGRPFLRDHELAGDLGADVAGPVHLIACTKGVTESQARNLLGFPDATIVVADFGVYVADNIQKIQLLFLAECCDPTSTRQAIQRAFEWLSGSGEDEYLAKRSISRRNIVCAVAAEVTT